MYITEHIPGPKTVSLPLDDSRFLLYYARLIFTHNRVDRMVRFCRDIFRRSNAMGAFGGRNFYVAEPEGNLPEIGSTTIV